MLLHLIKFVINYTVPESRTTSAEHKVCACAHSKGRGGRLETTQVVHVFAFAYVSHLARIILREEKARDMCMQPVSSAWGAKKATVHPVGPLGLGGGETEDSQGF